MSRLDNNLCEGYIRSYKAEGSELNTGDFVKEGTDVEQQAKIIDDFADTFLGVVVVGAGEDQQAQVVEENACVPVICAGAITGVNKRLYFDKTYPQKVTLTKPTDAGTYVSPGISKSITGAADEKVMLWIDRLDFTVTV
jgi:hypothetical protein